MGCEESGVDEEVVKVLVPMVAAPEAAKEVVAPTEAPEEAIDALEA